MMTIPRILSTVLLLSSIPSLAQSLHAGDAIARIQHLYAAAPPPNTVDTIKVGDPNTVVTGITTTFLDTMDVLRESVKRGNNLIITHEPTFYNHLDDTKFFTDDPVYKEKLAFIEEHHLVVFRLHDEIHADTTDHILTGVYEALGWQEYPHQVGPEGQYFVTIPQTTLEQLARRLETQLHIQTLRVEGDPKLSISHVAMAPGSAGLHDQVSALRKPDVDVLVAGEASEWETVEYVRDAVAQGRHKALILLGHEVSEEPGMERCAKELRELFPGVRVDHIEAGQPLWNPEHEPVAKK
jgi:putative NIF3 family GTP cyclohydrolase 1 type 2